MALVQSFGGGGGKPKKKKKPLETTSTAAQKRMGRGGMAPDVFKAGQAPVRASATAKQPRPQPGIIPQKTTEDKIRDIALGYYDPNGVLPGPGKTVDLLSTALASVNDKTAWNNFFVKTLADARVQEIEQFHDVTSDDIFYGGDPKRELPLVDKVLDSPWSPTYPLAESPYFQRVFEQDKSTSLTLPGNKSFRDVVQSALDHPDLALPALKEMGLVEAKSTGPVDDRQLLLDGVKTFVYRQNLADSVWKNDAAATANVWATGLADRKMSPAQSLRLLHADDESLKEFIWESSLSTKDPHVSEYEYQEWYSQRYGGDKLPASVAKNILQSRYMAGMPEFIGSVGYVLGVNNPEAARISAATYGKTAAGRKVDAASAAVVDSVLSSNITRGAMQIAGLPFVYGERGGVALAWTIADTLHRAHPEEEWKANKSLLSHAAENWKNSQGYTAMDEFLRLGGVNPVDHPWVSWAGTMTFETLLGMGIDKAGGAVARGAGHTKTAAKIGESFGARTATSLLAENKSPFINSEFFNHKIHPEDAVHLADNLNTPAEVARWFDKVGSIYMTGEVFDPSFPSLKVTHKMKRLADDTIPPQRRALYMPEEQTSLDLGRNAPQRAYQQAIHAGLSQAESVSIADDIIRASSGAGAPREKRLRVRAKLDALANRITESQRNIPAKAQWPEYVKELEAAGIENPTGENVYHLIDRKLNGRRAQTGKREIVAKPRQPVAFAPGKVDPMRERFGHIDGVNDLIDDLDATYGELSKGLDPAVVKGYERTIKEAELDLKAHREALIKNRQEKKAFLAQQKEVPVVETLASQEPSVSPRIAALEEEGSQLAQRIDEMKNKTAFTDNIDSPTTIEGLREYIASKGGISRDNPHWQRSGNISLKENRQAFHYLDQKTGGMSMDDLAAQLKVDAPQLGISDSNDLFRYFEEHPWEKTRGRTAGIAEKQARLNEIQAEIDAEKAKSPTRGAEPSVAPLVVNKGTGKLPPKLTIEEFDTVRPPLPGLDYHGSPAGQLGSLDPYITESVPPGVYTTSHNMHAQQYARGATARFSPEKLREIASQRGVKGIDLITGEWRKKVYDKSFGKGRVNYIEGTPKKSINLDRPLEPHTLHDLREAAKRTFSQGEMDNLDWASFEGKTGQQVYNKLLDELADMEIPRYEGIMYLQDLNYNLGKFGYEAFIRTEGRSVGGAKVTVWMDHAIESGSAKVVSLEDAYSRYSASYDRAARTHPDMVAQPREVQPSATPETAPPSGPTAGRPVETTGAGPASASDVAAFDEADAYYLRKLAETKERLDQAKADRAGLTTENAGKAVPATPSQSHRFYDPKHDNAVLSLMNSSSAYRKWALSSPAFRMTQATRVFRYIVLWKMSTVFRILTDEGLRLLLDDIWPSLPLPGGTDYRITMRLPVKLKKGERGQLRNPILTKGYLTPEAQAVMSEFPEYEAKISGMFERVQRNPWTIIKPEDASEWAKAYPGHVARHNAGPRGDAPYQDWGRAWRASMHEQTHVGGTVIPETDEMILKAAKDADSELRTLITSDPFYLGDDTHLGWLREQNIVLDDFLKNPDSPHAVDEYVSAVSNTGLRYVSHRVTRQHFFDGPDKFTNTQLRTAGADAAIRAQIGPIEGEATAGYHSKSAIKRTAMNVVDAPYKLLDYFGTQMKQEAFGTYFKRQLDELQGPKYPKMDAETLHDTAAVNAFEEAARRNYMATHSALEGRLSHVFLFLPAYVQQAKFWLPMIAKHPFTAYAVLSNMSKMPVSYKVPDWFPILGGMSTVDLRNMTVFPNSIRELPPPVTPIASTAADILAGFGVPGAEQARGVLGYGRGFPQGLPWNTSIDAMLYAGTGLLGQAIGTPTWNPGQWITDARKQDSASKFKLAGAESIASQRLRSTLVNLQVQFINGQPLNVTEAKRQTLIKQGAKGVEKFAVPLGVTITLPTVTVTMNGKKTKLDLQRVADGQYAYLSARPWEKSTVLAAYPEYAPVAKAWELEGEAQLKYLYENQWVIPFVETKYEKAQVAAQELRLGATASSSMLTPETYAANIRDRYQQVIGWKVNNDYEAFLKVNLTDWAKKQTKHLTPYQLKVFNKKDLPQRLVSQTKLFQSQNEAELVKAFGAASLQINSEVGDKLPMWVANAKTSSTTLSEGTYNFLSTLEKSGSDRAKNLLVNSALYDQYLAKKKEKQAEASDNFIKAAVEHYKSNLGPDDFKALGISVPNDYWGEKKADGSYPRYKKDGKINGVMGFLGIVDDQYAIMHRLYAQGKFGSDEYKSAYRKRAALIAAGRKDPALRPIIDKSISQFLISGPNALNEPRWQSVFGVTQGKKTPRANEMQATWEKVKNDFLEKGMTPKKVLEVRRKYGGVIGSNFDEAVRAWSWAYVDALAQTGRQALTSSDNPYGWASGWTVDSKYGKTMQKWMNDSAAFLLDRKHPLSPSFLREYDIANKAAGGNLLDDMINPLM